MTLLNIKYKKKTIKNIKIKYHTTAVLFPIYCVHTLMSMYI